MKTKCCMQLFSAAIVFLLCLTSFAGEKLENITTESEFEYFTQAYYMHPQPELIPRAIEYLGSSRLLTKHKNAELPTAAFFSKLFLDNSALVGGLRKVIDRQDPETQALLIKAINNTPEQLAKQTANGAAQNDIFWGAFFASGDYAYLNKLIDQLKFLDERKDIGLYLTAASAKWSLSSNARTHFRVRMAMEAMKVGDVRKMRPIATDILEKTPEQIREETAEVIREQKEKGVWK